MDRKQIRFMVKNIKFSMIFYYPNSHISISFYMIFIIKYSIFMWMNVLLRTIKLLS